MQHFRESDSSEKTTPNIYQIQSYLSFNVCVCGKVAFERPISLSCGHKFHFKCAREFIFSQQVADNQSYKCLICEGEYPSHGLNESINEINQDDHCNMKFIKLSHHMQNNKIQTQIDTNSNLSNQNSSQTISNEQSFKYLTPNTNKYPKQSRYSNYQDSDSTRKQNQMSSFNLSPAIALQHSLKKVQERVPFTDITAQINKLQIQNRSQQKDSLSQNQLQNENNKLEKIDSFVQQLESINKTKEDLQLLDPSQFEEKLKLSSNQLTYKQSYIQTLGETIIRNKEYLENVICSFSSSSSSLQQQENNQLKKINLSGSDYFKASSSISNSDLINNSFFSQTNLNMQYSLSIPKRMRKFLNSSQIITYSINSSMISQGSNKENVRNITTRRIRNNTLQVSFYEGVSYLCQSSLYSEIVSNQNHSNIKEQILTSQKQNQSFLKNLVLPFCIELKNLESDDNKSTFKNSQDYLVIFESSDLEREQRYLIVKSLYNYLDSNDTLLLSWIDIQTSTITKTLCNYFFGKQYCEIISNEFMRLHGKDKVRLISEKESERIKTQSENDSNNCKLTQKTIINFVEEQFQIIQKKRMIQHVIVITSSKNLFNLAEELKENDNFITTFVTLPETLLKTQDQQEFTNVSFELFSKALNPTRTINIKKLHLHLQINPYLNNLIDIFLINQNQIKAKVQKRTERTFLSKSKSSENILFGNDQEITMQIQDEKDDSDTCQLKKHIEISIGFLRKDKTELLFEVQFNRNIVPIYTTARLFNCSLNYSYVLAQNQQSPYDSLSCNANLPNFQQSQIMNSLNNYEEFQQNLNNLYFLVQYCKDDKHLCYNRKVIFSFWKYEVETLPKSTFKNIIYNKYKPIFDEISLKKQTEDFEELKQFQSYYQNI